MPGSEEGNHAPYFSLLKIVTIVLYYTANHGSELFDFEKSKGPLDNDPSDYFDRIVKYLVKLGFTEDEANTIRENAEKGNLVETEKEFIRVNVFRDIRYDEDKLAI